jgi:hypothetical protein
LTLAELAVGPLVAETTLDRWHRMVHLQRVEASVNAVDLRGLDDLIEIVDLS